MNGSIKVLATVLMMPYVIFKSAFDSDKKR